MKNVTKTLSKYLKNTSQPAALLTVLNEGAEPTAREIRAAGIANPSAVVHTLRSAGFRISSTARPTGGSKYRLYVRKN
jgi:hypothetical protein